MRLLHRSSHGDLTLTKDLHNNIPAYAILSHTWGKDEEEVTFHDMENGSGRGKKGYKKIELCGEQAARYGLQYFWVDTCCIDKSSSSELSEAINSMFRWYSDSEHCYVYLEDVQPDQEDFKQQFTRSRWFSRGWTLQELIAPRNLSFFGRDWSYLGTREHFSEEISSITRIPIAVVAGHPTELENFSIAQKMSWASTRKTTREEDLAYCLLGVFNVNIPLLYGEGSKSFIRLQEEIMKHTDDQSIFLYDLCQPGSMPSPSWSAISQSGPALFSDLVTTRTHFDGRGEIISTSKPEPEVGWKLHPCLALSPVNFHLAMDKLILRTREISEPYEMTNVGLRISGYMEPFEFIKSIKQSFALYLSCFERDQPMLAIGIVVQKLASRQDQFIRVAGIFAKTSIHRLNSLQRRTIYIQRRIAVEGIQYTLNTGRKLRFLLSTQFESNCPFRIVGVYPQNQWDYYEGFSRSAFAPKRPTGSDDLNWSWHASVSFLGDLTYGQLGVGIAFGYDETKDRCWCEAAIKRGQALGQSLETRDHEISAKDVWQKFSEEGGTIYSTRFIIFQQEYAYILELGFCSPSGDDKPVSISRTWKGAPIEVILKIRRRDGRRELDGCIKTDAQRWPN